VNLLGLGFLEEDPNLFSGEESGETRASDPCEEEAAPLKEVLCASQGPSSLNSGFFEEVIRPP
jgi:hypothetical protein